MALYSMGLPAVAGASADLWPSLSGVMTSAPLRGALRRPRRDARMRGSRQSEHAAAAREHPNPRTELPEFLRDSSSLPAPLLSSIDASTLSPTDMRSTMANMSPEALRSCGAVAVQLTPRTRPGLGLFASRPSIFSQFSRPMSSWSALSRLPRATTTTTPLISAVASQRRGFLSNGITSGLLAAREAAANRNPGSPTAQNAFYQLLLKANQPRIVIERYQSGRYATNEAATEAYNKAVQMVAGLGGVGVGHGHGHVHGQGGIPGSPGYVPPETLQAVSQAVAAQAHGGSMSISKPMAQPGTKEGPIHVVVNESFGSALFRWVKFFTYFAFFTYMSFVLVTLVIEWMTSMRRAVRQEPVNKAENQTARFSDVHGCDEAKDELQELVEFLRNPARFNSLGGKLPKGFLLVGPPGTGKTLLARAVAGEAGVPFFYMSGSEFDEMFVGVGAKRMRDLFAAAKVKSPSIVFIDELDSVGGKRSSRDPSWGKQTLNQLLTEIDGFDQNSGVILIGATNLPGSLDKALTRPGRFDRSVQVDLPDRRGRVEVLRHYANKIKCAADVDLESLAASTSGLSGADLANIVNMAAVRASRNRAASVQTDDFDWAKDRVLMGSEKRSMAQSEVHKLMTAYHEAGHALVMLSRESDAVTKLYKVTVLPRAQSLGHMSHLPSEDVYSMTAGNMQAAIAVALGGKMAEELVYGTDKTTSGVSSDLSNATGHAFSMVTRYGMSKKVGPVDFGDRYQDLSGEMKALIDAEVQRLLAESYEKVRELLTSKRRELDLLARALVEYETLSRDEVVKVIRGEKLDRPAPRGGSKMTVVLDPDVPIVDGGTTPTPSPGSSPGGIVAGPK